MKRVVKPRYALAALGLAGLMAAWSAGRANPIPTSVVIPAVGFGGFGGVTEDLPDATPITIQSPVTEKSARIWLKLQQTVRMPFANETPLEDVIKYVRSVTSDKEEFPEGIPVYVDPVALQAAEKTNQSPIQLDLDGLALGYTLRLALQQLGLDYYVAPEGLLYIVYADPSRSQDPMPRLLDEIQSARREINQLRKDVSDLKTLLTSHPAPSPPPAHHEPANLHAMSE